jgi:hypothetical protein
MYLPKASVFTNYLDIVGHGCERNDMPAVWRVLVSVDAADSNGRAVHTQPPLTHLHVPQTHANSKI